MSALNRWRKPAAHVAVCIAVALFAYLSIRSEASLAARQVQLAPLDSVPSSQ